MGAHSKIEWTHHTFNPWWGCVKISPGCEHCYAESFSKRTGNQVWGVNAPRRFFGDKHWDEPMKWNALAEAEGQRKRVFCASMADVFEDRPDLIEPRARLFSLIRKTPWLDWLLLTKRPQNVIKCVREVIAQFHCDPLDTADVLDEWLGGRPIPNIWLGTTVEDQARADERIPVLLEIPAHVRFLSCEPLLGPVDLPVEYEICRRTGLREYPFRLAERHRTKTIHGVDWVICGGESGPKARPMQVEWAQTLRDQCEAAGVPFFMKQMGGVKKPFPPIPVDLMIRELPQKMNREKS